MTERGITSRFLFMCLARANTMVLGTSDMRAKPPAMSPYRVQYPTESSDLFPVETKMAPSRLDMAMRMLPRMRAWIFSSATLTSRSSAKPRDLR